MLKSGHWSQVKVEKFLVESGKSLTKLFLPEERGIDAINSLGENYEVYISVVKMVRISSKRL